MKKLEETSEIRKIPKDFQEQQALHWDLRYGGLAKDRAMWRTVALVCLLITGITVVGYINTVSKGKYIPYIVEVDKLGTAVSYKPADRVRNVDHRILEATLGRFVYCMRTVSMDRRTLKVNIDELYSFLNPNDPAYHKVTDHFRNEKNDPYKRAEKIVTSVEVTSVMKMPSGEWVIKWQEDVFTRKGKIIPALSGGYQAIITLMLVPSSVNNEKDMNLSNPVGIYIRDINWQKEMTQ